MLIATNPLISVTPGLMIWTIVCFLVTLFVLKRFAFGPIQKTIDERRERIRQSLEEADRARDEARKLIEEHRALIRQARQESDEILSEARHVADAQRERVREETEADRQRRLEETKRQIEAETRRALEQIRQEVAELALEAAQKVTAQRARRRRPAAPDRGRDLRARLLRARRSGRDSRRPPHLRRGALRRRQGGGRARGRCATSSPSSSASPGRCRSSHELLRNPQVDPRAKASALDGVLAGSDDLVRNFMRLLAEKGRAGEVDEIAARVRAPGRARAGPARGRAHDRDRALRRRGATAIVGQIEQASGKKVEATRKVDPEPDRRPRPPGRLAASVDASVRGRLERLRHELTTARS